MSALQSLIQDGFPDIVARGAFGKNVSFVSFEMHNDHKLEKLFMSALTFGTVITSDGSRYSVLLKLKPQILKKTVTKRTINFTLYCHTQ